MEISHATKLTFVGLTLALSCAAGSACRSQRGTPPALTCRRLNTARRKTARDQKCGRRAARQPCELTSRLGRRAEAGPHQLQREVRWRLARSLAHAVLASPRSLLHIAHARAPVPRRRTGGGRLD